ncbi:MAG: 2-dehydropantoate 2-reductase [Gammaproteobacteria bacterium]|nr:2-dehydropantoate 2-reductase [Gammaproteobacteria bacterium]
MRIAIFGSGGVGGYFGGRLAEQGEDVIFIARGAHLEAMTRTGLQVDSIAGDFTLRKVSATDNPKQAGQVDYVICSVKAWQVQAAGKAMRPMIGPETLVISLQNGVEAPGQLIEVLGADAVVGGLCAIITFQTGPGHIKHNGANPLIRFGHLDNHADPRINTLSEAFNRCNGVKSSIPDDVNVALWQKFLLISPWSGVGAVTRAPIGVLLQQAETRQMLLDAMQEIYTLALARDIEMPQDSVQKTMNTLESFPPNSTTSMQRDIADSLPSELDAQNGAVVRLADEVEVDTPVNRFILGSLRSLELRARGALKF